MGTGNDRTIFLLIAAPEPTPHARPPVEVFTSEGVAREAFVRRRLEVDSNSAWAQLVAVEDHAIRPLCWFGSWPGPLPVSRHRTQHARRRWAVTAFELAASAVGPVRRLPSCLAPAGRAGFRVRSSPFASAAKATKRTVKRRLAR